MEVCLFGRFTISISGSAVQGLEGSKIQELLAYLLVSGEAHHTREALATLLWGEYPTAQARKYLRQALWHIQQAFEEPALSPFALRLQIDPEWVQLIQEASAQVDVKIFERGHALTQNCPGREFDSVQLLAAQRAVEVYRGPLLRGCFQEWCLYERERLESIYLELLDKLMDYSEQHQRYDEAIAYGAAVLRQDRARERTHRRLMRLYYLAGDRTAALRQFQRCVAALVEELGVEPAARTLDLYRQIRDDSLLAITGAKEPSGAPRSPGLSQLLPHLQQMHMAISSAERAVRLVIDEVQSAAAAPERAQARAVGDDQKDA